jgi:hypothetical protein
MNNQSDQNSISIKVVIQVVVTISCFLPLSLILLLAVHRPNEIANLIFSTLGKDSSTSKKDGDIPPNKFSTTIRSVELLKNENQIRFKILDRRTGNEITTKVCDVAKYMESTVYICNAQEGFVYDGVWTSKDRSNLKIKISKNGVLIESGTYENNV